MPVPLAERFSYSVPEAAALIGISRARLYQLINDGTIQSVQLGRRRLIRREAIAQMLESLEGVA